MRRLRAFLVRLLGLVSSSQGGRELDDELASHLQFNVEDNISHGMTRDEARRQALIALGGLEPTRERIRERRGLPLIERVAQDCRYALRGFRRAPLFTAVVVLTLAVGSGANAAIFSIFNQALVRALPVPATEQLVNLSSPGPKTGRTSTSSTFTADAVFSYPLFRDLERTQTVFTGVAAYREFTANISYRNQAWIEDSGLVSGSYFPVLQLTPALGRLLDAEDDRTAAQVVVLSHQFWRARFNGDPAVVNERLVVNGVPMTIVGVTPLEFEGTALEIRPQVFVPLTLAAQVMPGLRNNPFANSVDGSRPKRFDEDRLDHWLYLFARFKPGISLSSAEQEVNRPFAALINEVELPAQNSGLSKAAVERFKTRRLLLEPGRQGQRPERSELNAVFLLLFAVTGVVILIACANVANLLLARATARQREITIRLSLGAGRVRLIGQMLVEGFLLAFAGGLVGLVVARWTLSGIGALFTKEYAPLRFQVDARVLLFTLALAIVMTMLCGLSPALLVTRRDLITALRGDSADAPSTGRIRTSLATAQIALSLTLLVIAGLFIKSMLNVSRVELGMRIAGVTTFRLSPELSGYSPQQSSVYFDRIVEAVGRLPGVTSVTTSTVRVLSGSRSGTNVTVEGFTPEPDANTSSDAAEVGPDYFRTFGIPLLAGREFTTADAIGAPKVVIVNEAFARKFKLGRNVLGKRMRPGAGRRPPDIEIVGLVGDARYSQAKDALQPQFFLPYRQNPRLGALNFYVISRQPAESVISMIRSAVQKVDPSIPIDNLRPVASQAADPVTLDRLVTTLSVGFATVASLLAALGLYGVLAYNLAQRTREFGVRIALGASAFRVWRIVFGYVGRMTLIGGVLGTVAALAAGRLAESQLFQVPGYDAGVTIAAVFGIGAIALAAGCIPAWRASRIQPAQALRWE